MTLRRRVLPLYLAVFAVLLPGLVLFSQAMPQIAGQEGGGYVVICTAQGLAYVPAATDLPSPGPRTSPDSETCPVCLSFSLSQNTFTPSILAHFSPDAVGAEAYGMVSTVPFGNVARLRHWPRAPPV